MSLSPSALSFLRDQLANSQEFFDSSEALAAHVAAETGEDLSLILAYCDRHAAAAQLDPFYRFGD